MKGIENITEKIRQEAQAEIEQMERETHDRCEEILKNGERVANAAYWESLDQAAKAREQRKERAESMAALEVRKQILAVKQELLAQAFQMAVEKLCALPEEDYVRLLARMAAEAASGGEKVLFSQEDRARVGKKVVRAANQLLEGQRRPAGLTLSEQSRPIRGGLILEKDRVESNCSFEALVEQGRSRLTAEVARLLFQ